MTDAITIHNPRNRGGSTGHVLAKRSVTFTEIRRLSQNLSKIQLEMACEVFDEITKYHTGNKVLYKGWKSNDRHRTAGIKIKATRFVLPKHTINSWALSFNRDTERLLADLDRVFSMLDGKADPSIPLAGLSGERIADLRAGERIRCSYFDLRYYPASGTLHFFPRDKKLVERLNRLVGRHRQWLPPQDDRVSDAFWLQYECADKFDKEVQAAINARARASSDHPLHLINSRDEIEASRGNAAIDAALDAVLATRGIDVQAVLAPVEPNTPRLAAPAIAETEAA